METMYLFDVDGTLTPPRLKMDGEFASLFEEWVADKTFCLVSGSDIKKIEEQIPLSILAKAKLVFACAGNDVYDYESGEGVSISKREFLDSQKLIDYLLFELKYSNWPGKKFGNNFEYRTGLLNFSILGRESDKQNRDAYESWDIIDGERSRIANYINERFPEYEASKGGQISVDITQKGCNKSRVLDFLDTSKYEIRFFGDKIGFGGNDYVLARRIVDTKVGFPTSVDSWKDVQKLLMIGEKDD